jgi:hypothetical protein
MQKRFSLGMAGFREPVGATLTILSNDLLGPHVVAASGVAPASKANLIIADTGNFGDVCVGSFADEPILRVP